MALFSSSVLVAAIVTSLAYFVYAVARGIYNIYFSPLAHIPGPKLPIATSWYECYHDVLKRGLYYRKVAEFHRIYGKPLHYMPLRIGC
jgi:hypothetical protein